MPRYVCFVALREEMDHINARMEAENAVYQNGDYDAQRSEHTYEVRRRAGQAIEVTFFVLDEMGNIASASRVYGALSQVRPNATFILGIAGTLDLEMSRLGDVVVSGSARFIGPDKIQGVGETTFRNGDDGQDAPDGLDPMKRIGQDSWLRFRRMAIEHTGSQRIVARFLRSQTTGARTPLSPVGIDIIADDGMERFRNVAPQITRGAILGSDWVVDSEEFTAFLAARCLSRDDDWYARFGDADDADRNSWLNERVACLDMESYGFFRAVAEYRTLEDGMLQAFSVRGISDPCFDKRSIEGASRRAIRRIAADNAMQGLLDLAFFHAGLDAGRQV